MSSDWYQRKLGGNPAPAPANLPRAPQPNPAPSAYPQAPQQPSKPESLAEALADPNTQSKGGPAARTEHSNCPLCSSRNYFSRSNAEGARPRCYDCGYPVVQFGSETGDGGSIAATQGG